MTRHHSAMPTADTIIRGLGGNPDTGMCRCPAHDDKNPSLHVTTGNNGQVLIHCFADCPQEAVIDALKNRDLWSQRSATARPMNNLAPDFEDVDWKDADMKVDQQQTATAQPEDTARERWSRDAARCIINTALCGDGADRDYHAARLAPYLRGRGLDGKKVPASLLYLSVEGSRWLQTSIVGSRFPPYPAMLAPLVNNDGLQGVQVTFLTRGDRDNLRDASGKSVRKIYGRLKGGYVGLGWFADPDQPLLIAAEGVEKALAAAQLIGPHCPAIAVPGGNYAGVTPPSYPRLIIAADNDAPGMNKADKGAALWATLDHTVRIAAPTDHKDWDEAKRDRHADHAALTDLLLHGDLVRPGTSQISAKSAKDFMAIKFPPREYLLEPWLTTGSLAMIHAFRGNFKTWLAMVIAHAVATGDDLLDWKAGRPARVLYVDGELSGEQLQRRLKVLGPAPENLFILSRHDLQVHGATLPDLGMPEGRAFLDRIIERGQIELIILDSISTLVRSGVENDAESWTQIADWQLKHRFRQRSIVYLHHEGRTSNAPRGTSKREDLFDTMIRLQSRPEQSSDQETAFELSFTKARDFTGADAAAKLVFFSVADGLARWRHEAAQASKRDQIVKLLQQGELTQGDIAKRCGVDKGYVSRIVKQTGSQGMTPSLVDR